MGLVVHIGAMEESTEPVLHFASQQTVSIFQALLQLCLQWILIQVSLHCLFMHKALGLLKKHISAEEL